MAAEGDVNIKIQGSVRLVGDSPSSITPQSSTTANRSETSTSIMEITTTTTPSSRRVKQTTPREPQQVGSSLKRSYLKSLPLMPLLIYFNLPTMHSVKLSTFRINRTHDIIMLKYSGTSYFIVSRLSSPWVLWPKNWGKISALLHHWELPPQALSSASFHAIRCGTMWCVCVRACASISVITIPEVLHHLYLSCMGGTASAAAYYFSDVTMCD